MTIETLRKLGLERRSPDNTLDALATVEAVVLHIAERWLYDDDERGDMIDEFDLLDEYMLK